MSRIKISYVAILSFLMTTIVLNGNAQMNDVVFREYDIRGKVGSDLHIDAAYDVARAIAYYFVEKNPDVKTVVVGMDGRTHSPELADEICKGLIKSGLNVQFVGLCTSPVLYFATHTLPVDAGLMITASHNPKEYNGIKIRLGTQSVWGDAIREIRDLYKNKQFLTSDVPGSITDITIIDEYVDWLCNHFTGLKNRSMPIVIDCGNGSAGAVMPQLIEKMGWTDTHLLYPEVDGTYPNHDADPTKEENMQDVRFALKDIKGLVGVGFDGDADRVTAMTPEGQLVQGDQLLALFAKPIAERSKNAAVVFDVCCSAALSESLKSWNMVPYMSPTGSAYIKSTMDKTGAVLGGEVSCHFFFADRYFGYDDGIYAMMRLVQLLTDSSQTITQLVADLPQKYGSASIRMACPEEKKVSVVAAVKDYFAQRSDVSISTVDGVRVGFTDGAWGLVRASNTEPKLSMRFEADSPAGLVRIKDEFRSLLGAYLDPVVLRRHME